MTHSCLKISKNSLITISFSELLLFKKRKKKILSQPLSISTKLRILQVGKKGDLNCCAHVASLTPTRCLQKK